MREIIFLFALAAFIVGGVRLRNTVIGVAMLSGLVVGFLVAGTGGRVVMRIIAIVDPVMTTRFSIRGTLFLLLGMGAFGAMFGGVGGLLFVGIRRWLPVPGAWKGLAFGLVLLLATGGLFSSGGQEDFSDFQPPLLGVGLFATLYLLYGLGGRRGGGAFPQVLAPYGRARSAHARRLCRPRASLRGWTLLQLTGDCEHSCSGCIADASRGARQPGSEPCPPLGHQFGGCLALSRSGSKLLRGWPGGWRGCERNSRAAWMSPRLP